MAMKDNDTQYICHACIGDEYLSNEVETQGVTNQCGYCGEMRNSLTIGDLADRIHNALQEHYELTPDGPVDWYEHYKASEGEWERRGDPAEWVIAEAAGLDEKPAKDVTELLSAQHGYWAIREEGREDPYGYDATYERREPNDREFLYTWAEFRREIRSRSRFFSTESEGMLNFIFGDLYVHVSIGDRPVVREINPDGEDASIWRGRAALSAEELRSILASPSRELGPPPSRLAKAGRMNPQGISVFYGAMDKHTCMAEVRAPVGSGVVVGKFELLRTIRLLDLDALAGVYAGGSIFDPDYIERKGRAAFFRQLVSEISRPVMPQDEGLEYLSTQAVAEYLAQKTNPRIDGIIFRSSQTGGEGRNLVLFNHASVVEPYTVPNGTSLEISLPLNILDEPDIFDDITVYETVPSNPIEGNTTTREVDMNTSPIRLFEDESKDFANYSDPTLRLNLESIEVLGIQSVNYSSNSRSVSRNRETQEERDAFMQRLTGGFNYDELFSDE